MWNHMQSFGPGWGFGMGGFPMLIVWLAIIVAVVLLVRWAAGRGSAATPGGERALAILEARYARGEIDREEYQQKRQDLMR